MNNTSEENASKYWAFVLKWGIGTLKKKKKMDEMQVIVGCQANFVILDQ